MAASTPLKPDLCVIGGGSAGLSMVMAAAVLGLSCVLVEKRAAPGWSQAVDLATDMLLKVNTAEAPARPGSFAEAQAAYALLRRRIGLAVSAAAPDHSAERLRAMGITVIEATGRFTGRNTAMAGQQPIQARRYVVATGGRPSIPHIDGIDLIRVLTTDTVVGLTQLPERLAVLGDTVEALELAQAFARLGSAVTLVGRATEMPLADPEFMTAILSGLKRDGVDHRPASRVIRIEPRGSGLRLILEGGDAATVDATHLLVADGRKPFLEGLDLHRADVRMIDGAPDVGANLRTSQRPIFAMGDVLGAALPAAAVAAQAGVILRAGFLLQPARFDAARVPVAMRTCPAYAHVGLREAEARKRSGGVKLVRSSFAENARALASEQMGGHLKVVSGRNGQVLGASLAGPQASDLIAPWSLAVARRMSLDDMAAMSVVQPSLSEVSRRAALTHLTGQLRRPWGKRALAVLRRFG